MYRALIVDDEPMALFSIAHTFPWQQYGFAKPVATSSPQEALELLRSQYFDAAIVDIHMPGLSGIDLIRICGQENRGVVFVVLSGYSDFHYVQEALRLRAFDYCLKPILPDAADEALSRLTVRLRARRMAEDPALLSSMSNAAAVLNAAALRGLPAPGEKTAMALISSPALARSLALLAPWEGCLALFAAEDAVVIFTDQGEQALREALEETAGALCCYTQPMPLDSLNPARQLQLLTDTLREMTPGQAPVLARGGDCSPAFLALLDHVDRHLSDELSLQALAADFHLNYTYCSELFRAITGMTFTRYLTSHRMARAAELLIHSTLGINEIALQTGYGNYNHFSATFKTFFGQTPGVYRQEKQESEAQ